MSCTSSFPHISIPVSFLWLQNYAGKGYVNFYDILAAGLELLKVFLERIRKILADFLNILQLFPGHK